MNFVSGVSVSKMIGMWFEVGAFMVIGWILTTTRKSDILRGLFGKYVGAVIEYFGRLERKLKSILQLGF